MSSRKIEIPIGGAQAGDEENVMELDLDELPETATILEIFTNEQVKLPIWMQLASFFQLNGQHEDYFTFLEHAVKVPISHGEDHSQYNRLKLKACVDLASIYIQRGSQAAEMNSKRDLFSRAMALLGDAESIADTIGTMFEDLHVQKGFLLIYQHKSFDKAVRHFDYVLSHNAQHIPAILGKACVEFHTGKYAEALGHYKEVLRATPHCPASIRVAIGVCCGRLGLDDKAHAAFERALEVDPNSSLALVSLAVLQFNHPEEEHQRLGVQLLKRAYDADKNNPIVLNHLSSYFFFKGELERAWQLSYHALQMSDVSDIQAESYYQLGRIFHHQENYEEAFQYYSQATKLAPGFLLPQLGLGQMHLFKHDLPKAAECFDAILAAQPDNFEALKASGSVHGAMEDAASRRKGIDILRRIVKAFPGDIEVWIELAELLERSDPKEALEAYSKADALLQQSSMPPEVVNNMGCLRMNLGQHALALKDFEHALQLCDTSSAELSDADKAYFDAISVTIKYNQGRLHELMNDHSTAVALYDSLCDAHPAYIDPLLRLGCIARDGGNLQEAMRCLTKALQTDPNNLDARTLLANIHFSQREWGKAQEAYQAILNRRGDDGYALLGIGNIYQATARKDEDVSKYHAALKRASELYAKVLRSDPSNLFAANGIGCVLADKGRLAEAKDIFIRVQEASGDVVNPCVNLAHVYLEQGSEMNAIKLYQNTSTKFYNNNDAQMLVLLARAYFKAKRYDESAATLKKALHIAPNDEDVRFNLALAQMKRANALLRNPDLSLAELDSAVAMLEGSRRIFMYLKTSKSRHKYNPAQAAELAKRTDDYVKQSASRRTHICDEEEKKRVVAAEQAAKREALLRQMREAEEEKKRRQLEEEEVRRRKAQEWEEEVAKKGLAVLPSSEEPRREGKAKKKKHFDDLIDDTGVDEDDETNYNALNNRSEGSASPPASDAEDSREKRHKKSGKKKKDKKKHNKKAKRSSPGSGDESESDANEFAGFDNEEQNSAGSAGEDQVEEAADKDEGEGHRDEASLRDADQTSEEPAPAKKEKKRLKRHQSDDESDLDADDDFFKSQTHEQHAKEQEQVRRQTRALLDSDDDEDAQPMAD